jgi:hypothetical protein
MNKKGGAIIEFILILIVMFLLYQLGWLQIIWDFGTEIIQKIAGRLFNNG